MGNMTSRYVCGLNLINLVEIYFQYPHLQILIIYFLVGQLFTTMGLLIPLVGVISMIGAIYV